MSDEAFGRTLQRLADRAKEATKQDVTIVRHESASFFARGRTWTAAEAQGKLAWRPRSPSTHSIPLIQVYVATGRYKDARRLLDTAKLRVDETNAAEVGLMENLTKELEELSTP